MPVVLFGADYWSGLMDWIDNTLLAEGKVSPRDQQLYTITDEPGEVTSIMIEAITRSRSV